MIDTNAVRDSIAHYGHENQLIIAMEECAELAQAVSKALRSKENTVENKTHLAEEIADVLIMIENIKLIFNISDEGIQDWICLKQKRLKERISAGK